MASSESCMRSAIQHIEQTWSCKVRRAGGIYALTVNDRVMAVASVQAHAIHATAHEWLDVPMPDWSTLRRSSEDARCQAIIVARYDDAVVWVKQGDAGPFATLFAEGDAFPRVRIMRNRMAPMRYESRW